MTHALFRFTIDTNPPQVVVSLRGYHFAAMIGNKRFEHRLYLEIGGPRWVKEWFYPKEPKQPEI